MSEVLIVGIISAIVTLVGIFVSSKATRDSVMHKMDTNQQVMNAELNHVKENQDEMKEDLKAHNKYAQLFHESIPVLQEQIKESNRRIESLEKLVQRKIV
jgi:peptidoglycan hydrolase CwlO-like protein